MGKELNATTLQEAIKYLQDHPIRRLKVIRTQDKFFVGCDFQETHQKLLESNNDNKSATDYLILEYEPSINCYMFWKKSGIFSRPDSAVRAETNKLFRTIAEEANLTIGTIDD